VPRPRFWSPIGAGCHDREASRGRFENYQRINPSGEVEATDETPAIEKAAAEFKVLGHEADGAEAVTSDLLALAETAAE
jgi:hypothetical protein